MVSYSVFGCPVRAKKKKKMHQKYCLCCHTIFILSLYVKVVNSEQVCSVVLRSLPEFLSYSASARPWLVTRLELSFWASGYSWGKHWTFLNFFSTEAFFHSLYTVLYSYINLFMHALASGPNVSLGSPTPALPTLSFSSGLIFPLPAARPSPPPSLSFRDANLDFGQIESAANQVET